MSKKTLSIEKLKKAAKFTKKELKIINDTVDRLAEMELRPFVFMGLAAHCIGITHVATGIDLETLKEMTINSVEQ